NSMKKFVILTSIILSSSMLLFSSVTLDALDEMILSNNTSVRSQNETVVQANLDLKDAKANFSPSITFSGSATYMTDPLVGPIVMESSEIMSQMGLGSYADMATGYVTLYDGMDNTMYMGTLSLTQPLVTWGKLGKAVDLYSNILSAQTLRRDDLVSQYKAELRVRVWSLMYLEEMKSLLSEALSLSSRLVDISKDAYDNGMLLRQDWLNARISAMEVEVKDIEVDEQYSSVLQGLRTLVGDNSLLLSDIDFQMDESYLEKYKDSSLDELISLAAGDQSNNLKAIKNLIGAYSNQKTIAERSLYGIPDFALQADLSYSAERFPFVETGWRQNDNLSVNFSIGFKTTIWDGGKAMNDLNRAKSNIRSAEAQYDGAKNEIENAVKSNWNAQRSNLSNIEWLTMKLENLFLERENLSIEVELGQKSRSDVLSKELEIVDTKSEIVASKIALVQNVFTLDYLTGAEQP
ncbi:MAG: TolC family protein, partial [Candidatus Ornithospirochaeta sp.]